MTNDTLKSIIIIIKVEKKNVSKAKLLSADVERVRHEWSATCANQLMNAT